MDKLTVIFFCSWKFALTFPVAVYGLHMSAPDVLLYTNAGGILGVIFFAYFWQYLLKFWNNKILSKFKAKQAYKPIFTARRRKFIRIKNSYGFWGIIILNPIVISIPISTFLIVRFYGRKTQYLLALIIGQIAWSILYILFYLYIRQWLFTQ